jgi:hypothetical protein
MHCFRAKPRQPQGSYSGLVAQMTTILLDLEALHFEMALIHFLSSL